jgi:hypothetical protein
LKLKIGLLVDEQKVEAWLYKALERLQQSDYAEITLIINNTTPYHDNSGKYTIYNALRTLDNKLFKQKPDAQVTQDITPLFPDATLLNITPIQTPLTDALTKEDIQTIKDAKLDILVRGGLRILKGDILTAAKYGVWSYHFGDQDKSRGMADGGFWESIYKTPQTGVTLQILDDNLDGGKVLYRSWALTQQISPKKNINFLKWLATPFLARTLKRLHSLGEEKFFEEIERKVDNGLHFHDTPLYKKPTNKEAIIPFFIYLYKFIKRLVMKRFFDEEWFVMFNLNPKTAHSLPHYKKIISPLGILWADPFVVEKEDGYYIFVEEMEYKKNIGHLAVLEMDKEGNITKNSTILDTGSHLSYPNIFQEDGTWWMIPESGASRKISLYKATNFPYEWKLERHLMEGVKSADTTLHYHDNKWWMFVNIDEDEGSLLYNELFLFSADTFNTSDWKPHPQNPIVSDVKSSRPAGKIFLKNGKIIRPAQNSSVRYGYGLSFNEIITLNENEYEERQISQILPEWDKKIGGTHTFNQAGDLTVIDAWGLRNKFL